MTFPDVSDLIGVPFMDMGRDPANGLSCWGTCLEVARRMGLEWPDYEASVPSAYASAENDVQYREAEKSNLWERVQGRPQPGDLVTMSTDGRLPRAVNHFGVVIPGGRFIHTCRNHRTEAPKLNDMAWAPRMRGFWRWRG